MRMAQLLALPLILIGGPSATAQAPTVLEIHLSNFRFTPQSIVLDHGRPYVLRLVNDGGGGHDFTASEFFAGSAIAPRDRAMVMEGEVEVPGHQVREVQLTAPRAGHYKLKCSHPFHKTFGMKGTIVVR